jgi:hypothetical protein
MLFSSGPPIYEHEEDQTQDPKSPIRRVTRGYYLLDEYSRVESRNVISRRFWFDRVGGIRLARQQIFDRVGEIESDIVYGNVGTLGESSDFANLPLSILVTRLKEKYSLRLTYQTPGNALIGREYPAAAFVLQNTWGLEEVDLDSRLADLGIPPASEKGNATIAH